MMEGITFTITAEQAEKIADYTGIDSYDLEGDSDVICEALNNIIDEL
ncbi:hypothetical protein [uncultured Robinsoniella sp.]|nr:MAG TPA: Protein of unknown function (DUF2624) [Caudoviricetes sp.]